MVIAVIMFGFFVPSQEGACPVLIINIFSYGSSKKYWLRRILRDRTSKLDKLSPRSRIKIRSSLPLLFQISEQLEYNTFHIYASQPS